MEFQSQEQIALQKIVADALEQEAEAYEAGAAVYKISFFSRSKVKWLQKAASQARKKAAQVEGRFSEAFREVSIARENASRACKNASRMEKLALRTMRKRVCALRKAQVQAWNRAAAAWEVVVETIPLERKVVAAWEAQVKAAEMYTANPYHPNPFVERCAEYRKNLIEARERSAQVRKDALRAKEMVLYDLREASEARRYKEARKWDIRRKQEEISEEQKKAWNAKDWTEKYQAEAEIEECEKWILKYQDKVKKLDGIAQAWETAAEAWRDAEVTAQAEGELQAEVAAQAEK